MTEPAPGARVSLDAMYELLVGMDRKLTRLQPLEQIVADHEARLRVQERREDLAGRVSHLETTCERIDQRIEEGFHRSGERLGKLEQDVAAIRERDQLTVPLRVHPITYAAVVISALAVVASIVIASVTAGP
jgi:hypothetical protein